MLIDPTTNLPRKNWGKGKNPSLWPKADLCRAVRHFTEPPRFTTESLVTENCWDYITPGWRFTEVEWGRLKKVAPYLDFTLIADRQAIKIPTVVHTTKLFHGKPVARTHSFELAHLSSRRSTFHTSTWGVTAPLSPALPQKRSVHSSAALLHPRIPRISILVFLGSPSSYS
jgi:hypothetical protein